MEDKEKNIEETNSTEKQEVINEVEQKNEPEKVEEVKEETTEVTEENKTEEKKQHPKLFFVKKSLIGTTTKMNKLVIQKTSVPNLKQFTMVLFQLYLKMK